MTAEADSRTVEQLGQWEQTGYIELHRKLLGLKVKDSYLPVLNERIHRAATRFEKSPSVLKFRDVFPDEELFGELFSAAQSIVSQQFPASPLKSPPPSRMKKVASAWYRYSPLTEFDREEGVSREMLFLCLKSAFHPILVRYSEQLAPLVDQSSWRQKTCPVCGGKPDFAFLEREAGARWLVCSRCDAEWLFLRLECPFCGNQDQDSLSYFTNEKELYRLYVCERCRAYLKAVDLRRAAPEVLFPLERIITLDLDRQAHEAGYNPGW